MDHERRPQADYGLKIEEPHSNKNLPEPSILKIFLVFLCFSVCALFVQQFVYNNTAKCYDTAVSAALFSVDNSASVVIASSQALKMPVNVNTADVQELCRLNGIGETKALAIIEYRTANGPFTYKQELMNVSGIGEKLFAQIEQQIVLSDEELTTE